MALTKRTRLVLLVFGTVVVADIVLFAFYFRGCARERSAASTGADERADELQPVNR